MLALDMEGVITPEIWEAVAARTGVDDLLVTTRDEPDYEKLMKLRIDALDRHHIGMSLVLDVIDQMELLPGARAFLDEVRPHYGVMVVSDTFEEFARPLQERMGWPHLLCHRIETRGDRIVGFHLRIDDPKRRVVEAYKALNYHVTAVGDSYNDVNMIAAADAGFLFKAPERVIDDFPHLRVANSYDELLALLDGAARPGTHAA